jgi:hypothetical protein
MFKKLLAKALAAKFLKGKLTNLAAVGTTILPLLSAVGVDVLPTEWDAVVQGFLAGAAIYGRMRAKHQGA